ncbi:hypothetical protein VMCG_01856 [Cytospora schulzeri]|uniref:Uncharacterized protein n=1 Tax=Cytospora schulzeri TaxID=448051 RepID=A0A423X2P0_9PEZI|nr:hypothetical protein VMCG_01856 [Valsa malicola]
MGNTPSKEIQGRPSQKLAKPRNATQATAGLGGDLDPDKRNSFLGSSKPQRRLSLFRSKSSQEAAERRKSRRNTIVGAPVDYLTPENPSVVRANSVNTHNLERGSHRYSGLLVPENRSPTGCRASWTHDRSYETQRVLNRVQEQPTGLPRSNTFDSPFAPTPEEMQTPAWRRRSLPVQPRETQPPENASISRTNSELSMHPPMRRRSMIQTPGVATRSVRPGRTNARSSVRHGHTVTPTLATQASFETDDSIPSLPPLPTPYRLEIDAPRVATPKDGEYSTTGAFKLGTLRITNGSPDLTPAGSTEAEPTVSRPDYFTAIPPRAKSETIVDNVQTSTTSAELQKSDVAYRANAKPESGLSSKADVPSLSITVPPAGPVSQYTTGLQLSPIEIDDTPLFRPSLEIQTKHTAVEDLLFDMEDDSQPEIPAVEKLDVRLDPSAKGLPPQPLVEPTQPEGVKRTDSGFVSNSVSVSSTSNSSLTKADSGYSSSVSLRSFRSGKKTPATEKDTGRGSTESARNSPEIEDKEPRHALELQFPSPFSADDIIAPWAPETENAPTPPLKDQQAVCALPRNADGDDARAKPMSPGKTRIKAERQQLPNIDVGQTGDRHGRSYEPASPIPTSAKSDATDPMSPLSIGSNSQKHGRLHRLLSMRGSGFSRTPLTAHVTHAVDKQVPSVPKDIEEKLREHTGRFPMTTKRLALRSQMSKETLKTILSVGSLELAMEDELPSTPVFLDTDSESENAPCTSGDASLRQTINSMQSNFKQAAVSMMPNRKSITRKPVPIRKEPQESVANQVAENDGLELTSYNSVNSSLGSNAYDVAAKAMTEDYQSQRGRHASRSMTLTEKSHQLQLRTYSLNMPSSPSNGYLSPPSPSPSPRAVSPPKKERSQPPVSMETRSFRTPPPRSPLSPRSPAVLRKKSREAMRSPTSNTSDVPPVPTLIRRGSLDSIGRVAAVSASNYRAADWDPQAHQNSLGSQLSSLNNSRHNSPSSVPSDRVHRPARAHQSSQHSNEPVKQQFTIDGLVRNQQQAVDVPHAAHQGPRPRSLSQSDHWHHPKLVEDHQWNHHTRYPPYVPRGQHRRNQSAGNQPHHAPGHPPYRILHSYNSPAYRNAPIWG